MQDELRRNVEKSAEIATMALELADMTVAKKAKQVVINDLQENRTDGGRQQKTKRRSCKPHSIEQ